MESFDFQKGGEVDGILYPALRPLEKAVIRRDSLGDAEFVHYEPGNGTRYEVFIVLRPGSIRGADDWYPYGAIAVVNFGRPASMALPEHDLGLHDVDYIHEKMGVNLGDAYALIPLINDFIERHDHPASSDVEVVRKGKLELVPLDPVPNNSCNMHSDCSEANRKARERYDEDRRKPYREQNPDLNPWADHCHDETCEDCFGS